MNTNIKFGTDGWRGVIADDFTFENVSRVAKGICKYLKLKSGKKGVIVGYDRRFLSKEFAVAFSQILSGNGICVILSDRVISSPCLSYTTYKKKSACGIMLTASHNPPQFNGIKFKTADGASMSRLETDRIERLIPSDGASKKKSEFRVENFFTGYSNKLRSLFQFDEIKLKKLKIAFNPMHGAAAGYLKKVLPPTAHIAELNNLHDPLFGGRNPEPIERFMGDFKEFVLTTNSALGLAVDGDGDRIGVVDDKGEYVPPHTIFALILEHLLKNRKIEGDIVQGFALGYLSKRVAKAYNRKIIEVPVGFKYVAEKLSEKKYFIGAEESGGIGAGGFIDYIPERDGILSSLLAIDMLTTSGKKLSELKESLYSRYGMSFYARYDVRAEFSSAPEKIYDLLKLRFNPSVFSLVIKNIDELDGLKFVFSDDSWLLIRASGTEPVIRIYCESPEKKITVSLLETVRKLLSFA